LKTVVLLVMHGVPPSDFPPDELNEFFGLAGRLRRANPAERPALEARRRVLETKMRDWPRTPQNDPFYFSSKELAEGLGAATGIDVRLAFNEFCAPEIAATLEGIAENGAGRILVATTMMTRGGEHSETDITRAIEAARRRHPGAEIIYAWPYETGEVAGFLAAHIRRFLPDE
jgi:sirohydrochlorin cobaltochelatase